MQDEGQPGGRFLDQVGASTNEPGRQSLDSDCEITFFGTTTLLVRCGQSAVITDGFFTRPSLARVLFGKLKPDHVTISKALAGAAVRQLDAVLVGHSHYDHALDAPEVARQTNAKLVGSSSTAQIGRGWGLPESQIIVLAPFSRLTIGDLNVTFVPSKHSRPLLYPGTIRKPLTPPAQVSAYREGGSFSIHVASSRASILIHESANFLNASLAGGSAGTVCLAVAQLSRRPASFFQRYFAETVLAVGARRVIPIHWDHFQKAVGAGLERMPAWLDNVTPILDRLEAECAKHQIDYHVLQYGQSLKILD